MSGAPIVLTLYDKENQPIKTFTRTFIPWKILKRAAKLIKGVDLENLSEEAVDEISGLVMDIFGDQFTIKELEEGSDLEEMVTVLQQILTKVTGGLPPSNPTTQA